MILKAVIDILYILNETKKALALIVLSPFGLAAVSLLVFSVSGSEF